MNNLKLSIENFQSISEGNLEFKTGLNLIIGQSNSGKTATFRALKACLANPSGSQRYIKWNQKKACVTLEYAGNTITWARTSKESSYIINGETYIKTGASNAFKILGDNIGFIKDENSGYILNIEEELQLPFPTGMSKSELFKLYENVFCISDSAVILKSAKEQEDEIKGNINNLELELSKNATKISELNKFKKEIDLDKLRNMKESLVAKKDRLTFLNDGLDIIKSAINANSFDINVVDLVLENKMNSYTSLISCKKTISLVKSICKLEKELNEININVESKVKEYNEFKELAKVKDLLSKLSEISIEILSFDSKLQEYKDLKCYKTSLNKIRSNIKSNKEKLENKEIEIKKLEEKLKSYKVCPLCHSVLK